MYLNHLKYFKQALVCDYFRGKHSTGMTAVKANGDVFNKKVAVDPITFLDLKSVDDNIINSNTLIMGHNRHATLGGVNAQNAHPFEHGNITLMHNGTLTNKHALQTNHKAPVFGTDSELVCWLINEIGAEATVPLLEGAFALTWYDASDKTFNFIRNDERPMAMAVAGDVVLYASEWRMLTWLLDRNSLNIKDFELFAPKKGEHHKFSYEKKEVTQVVTEIPLFVAPVYKYPQYNAYNYNRNAYDDGFKTGDTVKKLPRSVGNSTDERFQQYKEAYGGDIKRGDTIFAYVDKVIEREYNKNSHFDLELSLVSSPYTTVKLFYVPKSKYPEIEKAFVVRGQATSVYAHASDPYFIIDHTFDIINEVTDKYYTEYEALAGDDAVGDDDVTDTEKGIVMIGHDRTLITTDEFRKATEAGCFVCKGTIDAEKEIKDMQESMIVNDTTAVCVHCTDHYEHCLQFNGVM